MAVTTILTHDVKNYDEWRTGFDAHEPVRAEAGFNIKSVHRDVDNPNRVTVIAEATSEEHAKTFIGNPGLKAAMDSLGVSNLNYSILNKA
ncbi:MAG: DUF3764 family protein [Bacteroidota bacterium]